MVEDFVEEIRATLEDTMHGFRKVLERDSVLQDIKCSRYSSFSEY